MTAKKLANSLPTVLCHFCANQGTTIVAYQLTGKDSETIYPNTIRYGCENGHKFALPAGRAA